MPNSPTLNVLTRQLTWLVQLRWIAALAVILGGMADLFFLRLYNTGRPVALVGIAILAYNAFFHFLLKPAAKQAPRVGPGAGDAHWVVWAQMLADLAALTLLVKLTGGYESPLRGLFLLHMVFASLLLAPKMAFGMALIAIGMVEGTLAAGGLPTNSTLVAVGVGWDVAMLATVYLASHVARDLRRAARRLARRNARIRQMAARLKQQQNALVHAEKISALGHMAAGVAHEVANPLASMDGLLQLMERRPDKLTPENLTRLREQITRINAIVRQLTQFARSGGGDVSSADEWRTESLNAVITRGLEVLRFDSRLKRIAITQELAPDLPAIRMLPAALEQVLINLVINAADAMEQTPEPKLLIKTIAPPADNGHSNQPPVVELQVTDNGHGMSDATRIRIFEPFFTTKQPGKGTGLGLSISYGLIQKHHGQILVETTPDRGTTFRIKLPQNP